MARYLCQLCDNVVTYGENHPCFFYKNDDNVYSLPDYWKDSSRLLSQADQQNERENYELKHLSMFQNNEEVIEVEGNENEFVTFFLENVESDYRPEHDQRETYEKTIAVIGPSDVDLQMQRVLDVSDLMHATAEEEDRYKVSGTANLIVNLDLPSGNKESKNGKQVSEGEIDEHTSLKMHCKGHSKKKKTATYLKEPISTKEMTMLWLDLREKIPS
ncbi:hypothetical protein HNY73_009732 [Argiope bruennichi]|uniref:Uncharacterized protein n=1 Tax=Argiope bruennichi TaxID=94029 RepID=A0A8T0FBC9_ARGBR|nr:hypothetical protein HNY73_009732 [Argiope bruennichi]